MKIRNYHEMDNDIYGLIQLKHAFNKPQQESARITDIHSLAATP